MRFHVLRQPLLCLILHNGKYHFDLIRTNNALTIVRPSRRVKIGENTVD